MAKKAFLRAALLGTAVAALIVARRHPASPASERDARVLRLVMVATPKGARPLFPLAMP